MWTSVKKLNPKAALKTCRGKPAPAGDAQVAHAKVGIVRIVQGEVCVAAAGDLASRHSEGALVHDAPDTQCVHSLLPEDKVKDKKQDQEQDPEPPSFVEPDAPEDPRQSGLNDDCDFHWCVEGESAASAEVSGKKTVSKMRRSRRMKLKVARRSAASAQPSST